ncbi:MAG: PA2779 family protein, partial [Desulfobacterales bacterium]
MGRIKNGVKFVSILMTLILVMISAPVPSIFAAMVATDAVLVDQDTLKARDQLRSFLTREDVQCYLTTRGIDPAEAQARIDSLSDIEIRQIADQIDRLPAGGSFWGTVLFLSIIAFLV